MVSSSEMVQILIPQQILDNIWLPSNILGGRLLHKGPLIHHLAVKNCQGYVVEFSIYNISGDNLVSLISSAKQRIS